jgi:hypothetical protein
MDVVTFSRPRIAVASWRIWRISHPWRCTRTTASSTTSATGCDSRRDLGVVPLHTATGLPIAVIRNYARSRNVPYL